MSSEITEKGRALLKRTASEKYLNEYDRIFGKKLAEEEPTADDAEKSTECAPKIFCFKTL